MRRFIYLLGGLFCFSIVACEGQKVPETTKPIVAVAPAPTPKAVHETGKVIESEPIQGTNSSYAVYLPKSYQADRPMPVSGAAWPIFTVKACGAAGATAGALAEGAAGASVLPEGMSRERFEQIESYGAGIIKTHGSESNVKEIYDECNRMNREHPDTVRIRP